MKTISRKELYEQVWSKPMTKVAANYGVTSTALKKTCNRHHIPTPKRGYWAKLENGKPVKKESLPQLAEPNLAMIRIAGSSEQHLSPLVREARQKARDKLNRHAEANTTPITVPDPNPGLSEPPCLVATRRAIFKARPDDQGFAAVRSKGVVPLRIAPASIERGMRVLSQLFALAQTQGHLPKTTENGLVLIVENEAIAFGLEEQSEKSLHQPTPAELKRRDERSRWGYTSDPWPKYDASGKRVGSRYARQTESRSGEKNPRKHRAHETSLTVASVERGQQLACQRSSRKRPRFSGQAVSLGRNSNYRAGPA